MSFNPWLITWEVVNENNPVPENLIAAILPNRTSTKEVERIMSLLYHNEGGYFSEQLRFAKRQYGYQVSRISLTMKYQLGSSPFLYARHVFNFKIESQDDGDEIATWEDHDFDQTQLRSGECPTFVWVRKRTYRKSSHRIIRQAAVRGEIPRRKKRERNPSG